MKPFFLSNFLSFLKVLRGRSGTNKMEEPLLNNDSGNKKDKEKLGRGETINSEKGIISGGTENSSTSTLLSPPPSSSTPTHISPPPVIKPQGSSFFDLMSFWKNQESVGTSFSHHHHFTRERSYSAFGGLGSLSISSNNVKRKFPTMGPLDIRSDDRKSIKQELRKSKQEEENPKSQSSLTLRPSSHKDQQSTPSNSNLSTTVNPTTSSSMKKFPTFRDVKSEPQQSGSRRLKRNSIMELQVRPQFSKYDRKISFEIVCRRSLINKNLLPRSIRSDFEWKMGEIQESQLIWAMGSLFA